MPLTITIPANKTCIFHPNGRDAAENPVTPGVREYRVTDNSVLSLEPDAGGDPNNVKITPLKAGQTDIAFACKNSNGPGEPEISAGGPVTVTVTPGPLHHFAPTADAPV